MDFEPIQLEALKAVKDLLERREVENYDGSLEQAKKNADEFTERTGMKAFVIRRKNKYDWVSKYFFKTYKYSGKVYYETSEQYG